MPDAARPFSEIFGRAPELEASAPGRVNLVGEHTDYNDGFVLPVAIPQRTTVRLAARADRNVRAWSASVRGADQEMAYGLGMERPRAAWLDYVQGVTWALAQAGFEPRGFDLQVESTVPLGAGLSSSAALEVALVRALNLRFGWRIDAVEIARIAHAAETGFVGVPVGTMDQMAASLATTDAALFIDTRSLTFERVPIPPQVELLIIDSGITHQHAGGEYRTRRRECEEAAARLGVTALRDATAEMLIAAGLPPPLDRRAKHVITENERVLEMKAALAGGNVPAAGAIMNASHRSMRDDFEVSTPAIDRLVSAAQHEHRIAGARLTGGGFGGCIVALVARGHAADAGTAVVRACADALPHARVLVP
jgi:galactokinase